MSFQSTEHQSDGQQPIFSILVPSYNPAPFLEIAMRTALEQMGPDDELLIQDAGSTDGTQSVIAAVATADSRVKPVIEADEGQSDALNRALARARPSWVVWLNSDDVLLPGALDAMREAITANPDADIIYGAHRVLRVDGTSVDIYRGRPMTTSLLLKWGITSFSGSIVMRTETLRELGGLKKELHCAMDYDLQFRIARTPLRQVGIAAPIGALRFHDTSKSGTLWKGFVRESARLRMRYSDSFAQRALGVFGIAVHLAVIPGFRLRQSPAYRAVRKRDIPQVGAQRS